MIEIVSIVGETLITGTTEWKYDTIVADTQNINKLILSGQIRTSVPNASAMFLFLLNDITLYKFDCNSDSYQTLDYVLDNVKEFIFSQENIWRISLRVLKIITVDTYLNNINIIGG